MTVFDVRKPKTNTAGLISLSYAEWKILAFRANDCLADGPVNWLSGHCSGETSNPINAAKVADKNFFTFTGNAFQMYLEDLRRERMKPLVLMLVSSEA